MTLPQPAKTTPKWGKHYGQGFTEIGRGISYVHQKIGGFQFLFLGLIYAFGFVVWAISAHFSNVNVVAEPDAQHFVAGMIIVATYTLVYLFGRAVSAGLENIQEFFGEEAPEAKIATGVLALALIGALGFAVWISSGWIQITLALATMSVIFGMLIDMAIRWDWSAIGFLVIVVSVPFFLVSWVHGEIPQEFGGFGPRCVTVTVNPTGLTGNDLLHLVAKPDLDPQQSAVHSKPVEIVFENSKSTFVRHAPGDPKSVIELRSGVVTSVLPSNDCDSVVHDEDVDSIVD